MNRRHFLATALAATLSPIAAQTGIRLADGVQISRRGGLRTQVDGGHEERSRKARLGREGRGEPVVL